MKKLLCFTTMLMLLLHLSAGQALAMSATPPQNAVSGLFNEASVESYLYPQTGTRWMRFPPLFGNDVAYCCMADGSIYRWGLGEAAPEKLCAVVPWPDERVSYADMSKAQREQADQTMTKLAVSGQTLYAVNEYTGRIGTVDAQGIAWQESGFDNADFFSANGDQRCYTASFADDTTLYLQAEYGEEESSLYWNHSVLTLDLHTGATRRYKTPGMQAMCLYREGSMLLLRRSKANTYLLTALDLATGALSDLTYALPSVDDGIGGLAYDPASDAIYYMDQGGIYQSIGGAAFTRILPHSYGNLVHEFTQGFITKDGRYGANLDGIVVFNTKELPTANSTLQLCLSTPDEASTAAFAAVRPEITLDMRYEDGMTAADIAERIRTGDDQTDIFEVMVDSSFSTLVEKGYAASLNASETLVSGAATLHPAIQHALTSTSGMLAAYPIELRISLWQVNNELWQTYFGSEPPPTTWTAFFQTMLRFEESEGPDNGDLFVHEWSYESMVKRMINAYMEQHDTPDAPLRFDTPALREALDALASVNSLMLSRGITHQSEADLYPTAELLNRSLFYMGGSGDQLLTTADSLSGGEMLPLAFSDVDTSVIHGYLSVLIVNPLSQRQELARDYIACAAARNTDVVRYYKLHPDAVEPVEEPNYAQQIAQYKADKATLTNKLAAQTDAVQRSTLEDQLKNVQWYLDHEDFLRWQIPPEGIAAWQRIAPTIRYFEHSAFVTLTDGAVAHQIDALCSQYASAQQEVGVFLEQLDGTMHMIWLEQQGA
ncbi:MAG: hypothetical protein RR367_06605 [Clostridia bacterium]